MIESICQVVPAVGERRTSRDRIPTPFVKDRLCCELVGSEGHRKSRKKTYTLMPGGDRGV